MLAKMHRAGGRGNRHTLSTPVRMNDGDEDHVRDGVGQVAQNAEDVEVERHGGRARGQRWRE